jgi:hypothetical protein
MSHNVKQNAVNYEQEFRNAAIELEREHHRFLGLMDVIKGLLMWIETTDERVRKNLSLRVDVA